MVQSDRTLASVGHEIAVIDNFQRDIKLVDVDGISLFPGSVSDFDFLNSKIRDFKPEIIINAAASYKDPHDLLGDVNTNINGSINICKSAEQNSVERIINFQTALCYGRPQALPIDEKHPVSPFTVMVFLRLPENFIVYRQRKLCVTGVNITGSDYQLVDTAFYSRLKKSVFLYRIKARFSRYYDFLNIMDLIINQNEITGIYNISTGILHSIREIYNAVCQHFNIDSDGVGFVWLSLTMSSLFGRNKGKKELGWSASIVFLK